MDRIYSFFHSRGAFILSAGFRPFFMLTALHALSSLLFWGLWLVAQTFGSGIEALTLASPAYLWHGHEMLFGFLSAAIAGFLLTAVPNWTQTPPITGRALGVLVGLWILGRLAFWTSALWPEWIIPLADLPFIPVLAWMITRALRQAKTARNLPFIPLLALFALANAFDHGSLLGLWDGETWGRTIAVDGVVVMMVIIGGRVTPTFSRNWLVSHSKPADVLAPALWDRLAILSTVAVLLSDCIALGWFLSGASPEQASTLSLVRAGALIAATLAVGSRALRWKPWRVHAEPLLWVLHLGIAWVVFGFALRAWTIIGPIGGWSAPEATTALHAHMVGAAGTLILGIMGRATLGHSGYPLTASISMTISYGAVGASALLRCLGPWLIPQDYGLWMGASALLWCISFILYLNRFGRILLTPRQG